jgi:hypothetical protein
MNNKQVADVQSEDFFVHDTPPTDGDAPDNKFVEWQASEFLHHQKSAGWYLLAVSALAVLGLLSYLLTRDLFGPVSIVVIGALFLVAAQRKPRVIQYLVDVQGVVVGSKEYGYDDFQSFSVVHEDAVESIMLVPQKRLLPNINLYFGPDEGQRVFDILSEHIPLEDRQKDSIDRFLHKIRF